MPATSKAQQKAAGAALAAKRGETSPDKLEEAARQMYNTMTIAELEELAATPLAGLPEHAADKSADMGHGDQLRHQQQQNQDRRQNQAGQNQRHGQAQDGNKKDKNAPNDPGNLDQNDPRRLKEDEESEDDFGNKHADRVPDTTRNPAPDEQRQFSRDTRDDNAV